MIGTRSGRLSLSSDRNKKNLGSDVLECPSQSGHKFLFFLCVFVQRPIEHEENIVAVDLQGIPWFSYTWVTLSVPVGGVLMVVTTVLNIRALILHICSV